MSDQTLTDRVARRVAVAELFRSRPRVWLPCRAFYGPGGRDGWRTRVSENRRAGMNISPAKVISVRRADGSMKYRLSFYRYVPPTEHAEA